MKFRMVILLLGMFGLCSISWAVSDLYIVKGNTYPYYYGQVVGSVGPVDIAGATMTATMANISYSISNTFTAKFVSSPVVITSGVNGLFEYRWSASDVNTAGTYNIRFSITKDGIVYTIPTTVIARVIIIP